MARPGGVIGLLLVGVLWQTGRVVLVFAVGIAIAAVADIATSGVVGRLGGRRRPAAAVV